MFSTINITIKPNKNYVGGELGEREIEILNSPYNLDGNSTLKIMFLNPF
jgi:hypothetical protein